MELNGKRVLVCNCEMSMALDGGALAKACGASGAAHVNTQLCRAQIDNFRNALAAGDEVVVACTQEAPLFEEARAEAGAAQAVAYANIRERAGWSSQGGAALPKIAALLAEACLTAPDAPTVSLTSGGVTLVYGRDQLAIDVARRLAGRLDVTVLLSEPADVVPPRIFDVPVFKGTISAARGHLGAFEIVVDNYAPMVVSSRQALAFEPAKDGAASRADLILDLTGRPSLFPAPEKRDGYFRPDPAEPGAVERALFEVTDLVGDFDKPRYVDFDAGLCVHSRSRVIGCTRCLDACPASAIASAGDTVEIDAFVCGGCGLCAAVCPTSAASYTLPPANHVARRLATLLDAYAKAGGKHPVLVLADERHGEEVISFMSRFGDGLPANAIPFTLNEVTQVGFEFLVTAFAFGVEHVVVLAPPRRADELAPLYGQIEMADAVLDGLGYGAGRVTVTTEADPDPVEASLRGLAPSPAAPVGSFLPVGDKRAIAGLALSHLRAHAPTATDIVALPAGAAYGTVEVNVEGCTVCLACVGACPTGALIDNPERPQLSFREAACVQCGLCRNTCPEKVIELTPRLNLSEDAREARLIKEEEPFHCVRCGKPFGTKSSIERIVAQLADKHYMFQGAGADRLKMCEDCRVVVQFEAPHPMAGPPRPGVRTTEDDLREREIEEAREAVRRERGDKKPDEEDG